MNQGSTSRFTGRRMAAIMVAFFAVIIAVNLTMARLASSTFGGVTVQNSYVASQHFNRWLDEADAERALGWGAVMERRPDGRVELTLSGVSAGVTSVEATARHPLGRENDQMLQFAATAGQTFVSTSVLPTGRWKLRITVQADGRRWRTEGDIR